MSFTTGALFYHESVRIIELFSSLKQWEKVREAVIAENAIQARTTTTLKRVSA
ncbi:MAG: BrxA family protein [Desulfovibrio piger]